MNPISDRYRRLASAFGDKIAHVSEDAWANQSPCDEWTARDVVGHVVQTQGMFLGFVGRDLGDLPSVDDDPAGAWSAASSTVLAALDDPEVAGQTFEGYFGESTLEAAVDRFLSADLIVHGWDLARATGQDETIEPGDIDDMFALARGFGDALRSPGAFGPEVEAPPGASEQDKLLAFLGRRP
jgi:uncharacterized protein (TIGR03086 family)